MQEKNESNFEKMIRLATQVFDVKNDPDQLDVNEDVIEHLKRIHHSTVSEMANENGPITWVILIPTTQILMEQFVKGDISEKQLSELTPYNTCYEAIYLCSVLVLEDFRGKGIAKKLTINAISEIQSTHKIENLFVWPFSNEGMELAKKIAMQTNIPLQVRH